MFQWTDFSFQVENTCDVEQVCIPRDHEVCLEVTDMVCSAVAYTGTNPAQANKIKREVHVNEAGASRA